MARRQVRRVVALFAVVALLLGGGSIVVFYPNLVAWYEFRERFESLGPNAQGRREYRHRATGIVFVDIPSGRFVMGAPESETGSLTKERPRHEVSLDGFLVAKYEVRRSEWGTGTGTSWAAHEAEYPSTRYGFLDVREFCERHGFQLPTEAQWEYACRAGSMGPYGGTGKLDEMGWFLGNSGRSPHPVGQKKPNGWGLHDMHGNVLEWCEDVFDPNFYSKPEATAKNPISREGSKKRVLRGGSCGGNFKRARSADRASYEPSPGRGPGLGGDRGFGFRPTAIR